MASEQETIISIRGDENTVHVYSTVPVWWRRAEVAGGKLGKVGKDREAGKEMWREYTLPLGTVKLRGKSAARIEQGKRLAAATAEKRQAKTADVSGAKGAPVEQKAL